MHNQYIRSFSFYRRFLVTFFILSNIFLWISNFGYFYELIKIGGDFSTALHSVYDVSNTVAGSQLLVTGTLILLNSIYIALLTEYFSLVKNVNKNKDKDKDESAHSGNFKLQSFIYLVLSFAFTTCFTCSMIIFGGLVSLSFLAYLPFAGLELGLIFIIFLIYVNIKLIHKLNNPYVC